MRALIAILPFVLALPAASAGPPGVPPAADQPKPYDDQVRPFLVRHCLECHGVEKPKGDLRLDRLSLDFADKASLERWRAVLRRVTAGEMPPKSKPRPPEKEVRALADWIRGQAQAAEAARRAAQG